MGWVPFEVGRCRGLGPLPSERRVELDGLAEGSDHWHQVLPLAIVLFHISSKKMWKTVLPKQNKRMQR